MGSRWPKGRPVHLVVEGDVPHAVVQDPPPITTTRLARATCPICQKRGAAA